MIEANRIYLLVDASSPTLYTGILKDGNWAALCSCGGDTLEQLMPLANRTLKEANVALKDIDGICYCEGPGTLLGLRLSAMAVNAWHVLLGRDKPVALYAYKSLTAAGLSNLQADYIISPFRRENYNCYSVKRGELKLIDADTAKQLEGTVLYLQQRRLKQEIPAEWTPANYSPKAFPEICQSEGFLRAVDLADAWVPEETEYVRWTQARHS